VRSHQFFLPFAHRHIASLLAFTLVSILHYIAALALLVAEQVTPCSLVALVAAPFTSSSKAPVVLLVVLGQTVHSISSNSFLAVALNLAVVQESDSSSGAVRRKISTDPARPCQAWDRASSRGMMRDTFGSLSFMRHGAGTAAKLYLLWRALRRS
jgi:hypothetical protein